MANRNVNILLKLQDQFTTPMREAGKITKEQQKAMAKCSEKVIGFSRNVRNGFLGGVSHVAKFGAALAGISGVLSIGALKSFAAEAEDLAKKQVEAETKLEAVLGNVHSIAAGGTEAIAAAQEQLLGVASNLQKVGVIGDEVTIAGMQQLATFQLSADQIETLSTGMTDLLAQQKGLNATQEDAVSVANLIGKAMTGNAGALSRVGIIMDDNQKKMLEQGDATQRAAVLAEILKDNVGGVNQALADTNQGSIQQFANNWGDMKEEVGKHILELKANLARNLGQYIPKIQEIAVKAVEKVSELVNRAVSWVQGHSEQIKAAIERVKQGVKTAWEYIRPVISFAIKHANTLIPAVLGVVGAISAVSVVADIAQKVSGLVTGFRNLVTAAKGLKSMLSAVSIVGFGPVGIAIAAVVAAGVLVYKNWDKIKAAAQKLWEKIGPIFEKIKGAAIKVKDTMVGAFNKIKEAVQPIIDLIKAIKKGMDEIGWGKGNSWGDNPGSFQENGGKALGTPYWRGGLTRINEGRRGEIVDLPSGTRIIPHDVAKQAVQGGRSVTVNVNIAGNIVGNKAYAEELGQYIARKVMGAWEVTA